VGVRVQRVCLTAVFTWAFGSPAKVWFDVRAAYFSAAPCSNVGHP